jgi:hypothetical protein
MKNEHVSPHSDRTMNNEHVSPHSDRKQLYNILHVYVKIILIKILIREKIHSPQTKCIFYE